MIEAKNITKVYNPNSRKANKVLDDASIMLPDTGFVFIVGQSGTGKSTILNAIGGLISYEGEILYDKKKVDIEQYRRRNIGYIFQDFLLFDELSVRDNIKIGLNLAGVYDEDEITRRVNILLKAVKLNINSKRRASALSLGQRQRVAVARALASNPHMILADEPTGNLDSMNSFNLMDILKTLSKNHLIVVVTHNLNLVNLYADKAFSIVDKKFTEINPRQAKLDENYAKARIDVSTMKEREFKEGKTLIRFYSDSLDADNEISLIRRGDKILVVGKNLVLADPKEVEFAKAESGTKSEENVEIKAEAMVVKKSDEVINLDFESRNEKEKFTSTPLWLNLKKAFGLDRFSKTEKKKRGLNAFDKVLKVIIPLFVFILWDIGLGLYETLTSSVPSYSEAKTQFAVGANPNLDEDTKVPDIDHFALSQLVYDGDSGAIDSTKYNYSYYESAYGGYTVKAGSSSLMRMASFSDFSIYADLVDKSGSYMSFSFPMNIADLTSYASICSDLNGKSVSGNEVYMDVSLLDYGSSSYKLSNANFFGGEAKDVLVGSTFSLPYTSVSGTKYMTYTIKGLVDTGFMNFYGSTATMETFRLLFPTLRAENANGETGYDLIEIPDLSGYLIKDYDDIKNDADYVFSSPVATDKWTTICSTAYASGYLMGYFSSGALADFGGTSTESENTEYETVGKGLMASEKDMTVSYAPDASKQVIVLRDMQISSSQSVDAYKKFISYLAYSNFVMHGHTLPSSGVTVSKGQSISKMNQVLIPSALADLCSDYSSLFYGSNLDKAYSSICIGKYSTGTEGVGDLDETGSVWAYYPKAVGVYESDNINDPIYMNASYMAELGVRSTGASYDYSSSYDAVNSSNYSSYDSKSQAFMASSFIIGNDIGKFQQALDNYNDGMYTAYTVDDCRTSYVNISLSSMSQSLITTVVVILAFMVFISVLNSISRVNSSKNQYGILRCLGMSKWKILGSDISEVFVNFLTSCLIPSLIALGILAAFNLFYLGFMYIPYLLIILLVDIFASELPLFITLCKKPMNIMRNLN